jgi:hypothetical protein
MSKLGLLHWNISHDNEMYGIIAAFLRIKGIPPPLSVLRQPGDGSGKPIPLGIAGDHAMQSANSKGAL